LDNSSPKNQPLPTVQQLKELLVVLESKIGCAGFIDSLHGWDAIMKSSEVGLQDVFIDPDDSENARGSPPINPFPNVPGTADSEPLLQATQQATQQADSLIPSTERTSAPFPDTSLLPFYKTVDAALVLNSSGPEVSLAPITRVPSTKIFGVFRKSGCPPGSVILDLLQALAGLDRVGEATSATIRVPPDISVWCIVFIKWCLGVAPSVRQIKTDGRYNNIELLNQPTSKVTIEIAEYGSKHFHVRAFRKIGQIQDLLWESRSVTPKASPWAGLLSPKIYFQSRVREFQTRHDLFHVIDTLLVMARSLTDSVTNLGTKGTARLACQFPPSEEIIDLVARIFDIDKVTTHLQKLDTSEVLDVWKRKKTFGFDVAALFFDILILSMVENSRYGNFDDFFVATPETRSLIPRYDIKMHLRSWLQGKLENNSLSLPVSKPSEMCLDILTLLGVDQNCPDGSKPLISSQRGQVAYPSLIETLTLNAKCPLLYRVFQGRLSYNGQYYAYATGDKQTETSNILWGSPGKSLTSSSPLLFQPTPERRSPNDPKDHRWFCTTRDNYLALYFAPYLHGKYSLDPDLFVEACESTIILQNCQDSCQSLEGLNEEILYCANLGSTFTSRSLRLLHVLTCADHIDALFIQASLVDLFSDVVEIHGLEKSKTIVVTKGQSCLSCACITALQILKQRFEGHEMEQARAIIVA
jgi:hypothetical protein